MFYGFSWVTTIFCKSLLTCFQIQEPGVFCTTKMADFFPSSIIIYPHITYQFKTMQKSLEFHGCYLSLSQNYIGQNSHFLKLISSSLNMGLSSLFSPVYKTDSKMEKKKKAQLKTKSRSVKKSSHKSSHSERKSIKSSRKKRTKVIF